MSLSYSSWEPTQQKRTSTIGKPPLKEGFETEKEKNEERQNNIHKLLEQMNQENMDEINAGLNNKVAQFEPMSLPTLGKKNDDNEDETANIQTVYSPQTAEFTNYRVAYNPTPMAAAPSFAASSLQSGGTQQQQHSAVSNDKLIEKLNYMIYLLEEQQHEKTQNVLEEFLLYCLVGVFIIFVVDTFAKNGGTSSSGMKMRYKR